MQRDRDDLYDSQTVADHDSTASVQALATIAVCFSTTRLKSSTEIGEVIIGNLKLTFHDVTECVVTHTAVTKASFENHLLVSLFFFFKRVAIGLRQLCLM